jgi:hypothetical protein
MPTVRMAAGIEDLVAEIASTITRDADRLIEDFGTDEQFVAEACHFMCRECALELARDRLLEEHMDVILRTIGEAALEAARQRCRGEARSEDLRRPASTPGAAAC